MPSKDPKKRREAVTRYRTRHPDRCRARSLRHYYKTVVPRARVVNHLKALEGCVACGFSDYRALAFHHKDPAEKEFDISGPRLLKDWKVILAEMAKCEILCRNCHAIRHAEEGQYVT